MDENLLGEKSCEQREWQLISGRKLVKVASVCVVTNRLGIIGDYLGRRRRWCVKVLLWIKSLGSDSFFLLASDSRRPAFISFIGVESKQKTKLTLRGEDFFLFSLRARKSEEKSPVASLTNTVSGETVSFLSSRDSHRGVWLWMEPVEALELSVSLSMRGNPPRRCFWANASEKTVWREPASTPQFRENRLKFPKKVLSNPPCGRSFHIEREWKNAEKERNCSVASTILISGFQKKSFLLAFFDALYFTSRFRHIPEQIKRRHGHNDKRRTWRRAKTSPKCQWTAFFGEKRHLSERTPSSACIHSRFRGQDSPRDVRRRQNWFNASCDEGREEEAVV